jgi:hypothetical protein
MAVYFTKSPLLINSPRFEGDFQNGRSQFEGGIDITTLVGITRYR